MVWLKPGRMFHPPGFLLSGLARFTRGSFLFEDLLWIAAGISPGAGFERQPTKASYIACGNAGSAMDSADAHSRCLPFGTKLPIRDFRYKVAFGGKADVARAVHFGSI